MHPFQCEECRAIYQELREAHRAAARDGSALQNTPREIAGWIQQLNEEKCAQIRETSSLWKTWRRMRGHLSRTGHTLSVLPLPPGALSNPN